MSEKRTDRVELRVDERGIGYAAVNGHNLRCTLEMTIEDGGSAETPEVTITMVAVVDAKVFGDLAHYRKAAKAAPPSETPAEPPPPEETTDAA